MQGKGEEPRPMKVLVEKNGPVTTVIINRSEARNAVDPETAATLREAFRAFEAGGDALAAVLCGAGGYFCGGYDLKALSAHGLRDPSELEGDGPMGPSRIDRKSTRLNSSHSQISYAVF